MDVNTIMIFDILIFFLFAYAIWTLLGGYLFRQKMAAYVAGVEEAKRSLKPLEEKVMIIKTETVKFDQDKELVLLYDRNDSFLGQGHTEDEAIENIRREFPTETFVLVDSTTKLSDPV